MENFVNWLSSWNVGGRTSIIWFLIFAVAILLFATKLVKNAEIIMAKTKVGASFVGGALIAVITSMPELVTEVSQSAIGYPEAGLADDLGSNAFSILLIAVAAFVFIKTPFLNKVQKWTKVTIIFSFLISLFILFSLTFIVDTEIGQAIKIGVIPLVIFLFYVVTIFLNYKFGDEAEISLEEHQKYDLKKVIFFFVLWSLLLVGASILLNVSASSFQRGFNIGSESVGGIFLSISTSLPEIVAFFALLRKKQTTAAISSLVGSHLFNYGITFFGDLAYDGGSTFNYQPVRDIWPLALITSLMILFLGVHLILAKYFNFTKKRVYLIFPSFIILTYIIGWALIIST